MLFVKVPFFIVLKTALAQRFRGFMPVVVDIETGGFNAATDAMLEIAAVLVDVDATQGWHRTATISHHVKPRCASTRSILGIRSDWPSARPTRWRICSSAFANWCRSMAAQGPF